MMVVVVCVYEGGREKEEEGLSPVLSPPPCLDLHPNDHTDCVPEPERLSVPRHALRAQNLRHPVPSGAERAEAEAQPQEVLHGGGPTQKRERRRRQVARLSVGAAGCCLPFLCFSWLQSGCCERSTETSEARNVSRSCPAWMGMPSES